MATNPANARIFGGDADSVSLAPLGTPLPTSINEPLNGAFEDVGWMHSDGAAETLTGSKTKIRGHQGRAVVRTFMEDPGTEFTFVALESKAQTYSLRYDERSVSTAGGVRATTRSPGQKVAARAAVFDWYDADDSTLKERVAISRFEIVPDGDRQIVNNDIAAFPFRGEILGLYGHWSNALVIKTSWSVNITGAPTGGTFSLLVNGAATAPIAYNASASAVAAALNAISGVTGISGITVSGTNPLTVVFPQTVILSSTSALTGGTGPVVVVS